MCPCATHVQVSLHVWGWFSWCVLSHVEQEGRGPILGSGCEGPSLQDSLSPSQAQCRNPQPSSGFSVGLSCQLGLWCNLLADPLPELRVPLGVGKLPSLTSPACLGASQNTGHTS